MNPLRLLFSVSALSIPLSACQPGPRSAPPVTPPQTPIDSGSSASTGANLLRNPSFSDAQTLPWARLFLEPARGDFAVIDGAGCVRIDHGGKNNWDVQLRQREMVIRKGHSYSVRFKVWSDKPTQIRAKIGMAGPPYAEYYFHHAQIGPAPQVLSGQFVMQGSDDPTAELAFHLGGNLVAAGTTPVTVCVDDLELLDPEFVPEAIEAEVAAPKVRVNQLGYFPTGEKKASVVSAAEAPLTWELQRDGTTVASGQSTVFGLDADSGDHLHHVDFGAFQQPGEGYVLRVAGDESAPFALSPRLYSQLKYDALRYFYHNRSGIEISMPYATDPKWTRPAGHVHSDRAVGCAPDAGCNYTLDVSKGWYDAGDHGKYVVNGGISVWTLMNQFERFSLLGDVRPFEDGKLQLPESGDGIPDILNEARWELEFLLGMQVPEGQPHEGMAHHKIHDTAWTGLGLAPHQAEKVTVRKLRPVSTAATLNLAAVAAQAARLFRTYDPAFAARCLLAAERAYAAAQKEPTVYADPNDGQSGGGPYADADVSDEFFWAAAELYASTQKSHYGADVRRSPFFRRLNRAVSDTPATMDWGQTAALGTLTLAIVPGALPQAERAALQRLLTQRGDEYLALVEQQGYRVPYSSGKKAEYPWGSNSFVLNNMLILAYAYDFTKAPQYLEGVASGMNYLLGHNAMGQSYVTGYGDRPLRHPHHRFWAEQHHPDFPPPPPGAVSGGPNSGLQDEHVQSAGLSGCAPQKCFTDHIDAWSVNEITINWNAPFAWLTAFLDENPPGVRSTHERSKK